MCLGWRCRVFLYAVVLFTGSWVLGLTKNPRERYPFALSKSSLYAVGAPHTWPHIVAALVWLIDCIKIEAQLADYHKMARKLKLIFKSAENSKGYDFKIKFNPEAGAKYLTRNLWKMTILTKCPYREFIDHL